MREAGISVVIISTGNDKDWHFELCGSVKPIKFSDLRGERVQREIGTSSVFDAIIPRHLAGSKGPQHKFDERDIVMKTASAELSEPTSLHKDRCNRIGRRTKALQVGNRLRIVATFGLGHYPSVGSPLSFGRVRNLTN